MDIMVILMSSFFVSQGFNSGNNVNYINIFFKTFVVQSIIYTSVFIMFNIYNKLWRCANIKDMLVCCVSSVVAGLVYSLYLIRFFSGVSLQYCFVNVLLSTLFLCIYRIIYKMIRKFVVWVCDKSGDVQSFGNGAYKFNTLIIEDESNLDKLSLQLLTIDKNVYDIKGIITDSPFVNHTTVNGVKILGLLSETKNVCDQLGIKRILVSNGVLSDKSVLKMLNESVKDTDIKLLKFNTIEYIDDINQAKIKLKEVNIADLLERETIDIKVSDVDFVRNKVVLVTGGGGSIGSELCRQIIGYSPQKLIILDNYENNAYSIEQELKRIHGDNVNVSVEIASVQDVEKIEKVFKLYNPELVFHAAAHKHVPLMEHNPEESVKNNVFGTLNVVKMSDKYNVEKFVLVSTDKAVNPTNIMGATKRIAEMIIQYYSKFSCTNFVAVRFGNVLGSNGSVIPLFKKQIESGGPVTVTHPNIERYFMTISEAASLILQAGELAQGGEIFVLDMGQPVKIKKLAENMIKLSGLTLDKDIKISYVGLRPGEKLYEELLMAEEGLRKTKNNKIFIGSPINFNLSQFTKNLEHLRVLADSNSSDEIFEFMPSMVDTYRRSNFVEEISIESKKAM